MQCRRGDFERVGFSSGRRRGTSVSIFSNFWVLHSSTSDDYASGRNHAAQLLTKVYKVSEFADIAVASQLNCKSFTLQGDFPSALGIIIIHYKSI